MTIDDTEVLARFPDVVLTHDNKDFYRGWLEKRLVFPRCASCGFILAEHQPLCPECWSADLHPVELTGSGTVHLLIWLHQGPPAPDVDYLVPYPVATVELDARPGLRFTSTILNARPGEVAIGDRVTLDWIERYGAPFPVFRQRNR